VKHAILVCALLAVGCDNKPAGFGVDVEARTNMLPSELRSAIASARLLVSGDESFASDIGDVGKAARSGAFKFRYVPGIHTGTLTIRVDAVDGSGATIAGGTAPPVALSDGKAVDAVLTLAVNGNGVTCQAATDCISGNCVDGVCCDSACDGLCESCNQAGTVGACTAAPMDTDPDNDCAAKVPMPPTSDGGVEDDDGGVSTLPPGVSPDNVQACAGTCNGSGTCSFAPAMTSCGTSYCPQTATVGAFVCDGAGTCGESDSTCTDYTCNNGACRSSCGDDTECQSTDFCNLNINQCVPKHPIGTTCTLGNQCQTGDCYSGVCCNTVCGDPTTQSCNNTGSVGQCQCTGHACPAGVACVLFYKDADNDTYGDANATLTNGNAVAGCTGDATPTGYSANNGDCDDANNLAHPGQTLWFSAPRANGSYDYNCNGLFDKGIPEGVVTCDFCGNDAKGACGFASTTCTNAGDTAGEICVRGKLTTCLPRSYTTIDSFPNPTVTYTGQFGVTVACGASNGNFFICGTCAAAMGTAGPVANGSATQVCH
jgi:hypothetical protein